MNKYIFFQSRKILLSHTIVNILIFLELYYIKQEGNEKKRPMSSYVGCKKDNSYLLNKHKYLS